MMLGFNHQQKKKKKNENQQMVDEQIPEGYSNSSPNNSRSTPMCPPGAQDLEQSAVPPGKELAE